MVTKSNQLHNRHLENLIGSLEPFVVMPIAVTAESAQNTSFGKNLVRSPHILELIIVYAHKSDYFGEGSLITYNISDTKGHYATCV